MPEQPRFDAVKYQETTRAQWQNAAEAWHRWIPVVRAWAGPATELMLELARVGPGGRVLDIAAGDGDQSLLALAGALATHAEANTRQNNAEMDEPTK